MVKVKKKFCARNYSNSDIENALKELRSGRISKRAIVKKFKIPRSTLLDIASGKSSKTIQPKGRDPYLTKEGEEEVYQWILKSAAAGFPVKKYRLCLTVQKIIKDLKIKTPFKGDKPGRKLLRVFLNRHSDLSQKIAENISKRRAVVTEENVFGIKNLKFI